MKTLKAIIFDLDDTLYPEEEFVRSGFKAVAVWGKDSIGIPFEEGLELLINLYHQGVRGDTFNQWFSHYGKNDKHLISSAVEIYRNHFPKLRLFPEVPDLLLRLKGKYLLGIISDGNYQTQQNKVDALGIKNNFNVIVLSDKWGREYWKPNTKPFEVALEQLSVNANEALYIGDNVLKDFLGARRVGIKTVWIRRAQGEYGTQEPPTPEHTSDYCIHSLNEIWDVIRVFTG